MSSMNDTKFTSSPWLLTPADAWKTGDGKHVQFGRFDISAGSTNRDDDDYYRIASVSNVSNLLENVHNAALIAAAPELYAALADALDSLEYIARNEPRMHGYGVRAERIESASAALAKARGES